LFKLSSKLLWRLQRWIRQTWARVVGFALLALLSAALAPWLAPLVPDDIANRIGSVAVGEILTILASSMLAVTTFSLSIAVSAFAAAASTATPRATALLQEDPATQNVLATFLGAFLFSLLGLIALRTELYDRDGRLVLFLVTLLVVTMVILALLRWITHLMSFGRMADTLDRVERAAMHSLRQRLANPWLGGQPWDGPIPGDAVAVLSGSTGYVQHVDMSALAHAVAGTEADLYLVALPGTFVHEAAPLVHVRGIAAAEIRGASIRSAFTVAHERTFDQDPRFGLIVLAEIASRALSPAVNDPGTAISVIGRLVRVLSDWKAPPAPVIEFPAVCVPTIQATDMIEDAFRPIARDGGHFIEVQVHLQKALTALAEISPKVFNEAVPPMQRYASARAPSSDMYANGPQA